MSGSVCTACNYIHVKSIFRLWGFSISDLCKSMANPCRRYLMLSDIDRCVSIAGQTSVTVISDADALILFRNPTSHPTTSSNRLRDYTARFFHVCFHGFYLFLPKVMFISNRFICFGAPLIQLHVMNHHSWNSDGGSGASFCCTNCRAFGGIVRVSSTKNTVGRLVFCFPEKQWV